MAKINGKEIKQVMQELRADFSEDKFDNRGDYPFLPYPAYLERMEEVVGFNYQCDVINAKYVKVENSPVLLGDARFIIYDDEGGVVLSRSYPCGDNVIVTNEGGICANFANATECLYQKAFSKGCKLFGLGVKQLKEKRGKKEKKGGNATNSSAQKRYSLEVTAPFSKVGNGYKGEAKVLELDEVREILIWSKGVKSIEKHMKMDEFCKRIVKGYEFHVYGMEQTYHDKKQIVLNAIEGK